jgi:exopolysaccharide biosynthesis polyprenyl glycosylphosphotransferase
MFRRFSTNFALLSIGFDFIWVAIALFLAVNIRPELGLWLSFAAPYDVAPVIPTLLYAIFPLAWVVVLLLFSVYDGRRNLRVADEISSLTIASILAGVALAGGLYLSFREISRVLFLAFSLFAYLGLLGWRLLARVVFRVRTNQQGGSRRVLVVGAGPVGRQLQEQISKNGYLNLNVVGFLDDDATKRLSGGDILGQLSEVVQVVKSYKIDDVVIALPTRAYEKANSLVANLHTMPVKVWMIPDYFHLALHKAVTEEFAGIPMLDLRAPALNDYQRMVKRAFDISFTLILMPFALPLMGIIALVIRLEGPGPLLFRQERVGENGRLFKMLKFRTMVPNAEKLRHLVERKDENGNLIHKSKGDPRVTRVGAILRKASMDELPQLFNILKGEMSWVGPRPELPYLVDMYEPWQRKRFAVPQGLTGWWQVNGRSDKPMHLNTEDDLFYVQNYSLILDIFILFKTAWVILRGRGAF